MKYGILKVVANLYILFSCAPFRHWDVHSRSVGEDGLQQQPYISEQYLKDSGPWVEMKWPKSSL